MELINNVLIMLSNGTIGLAVAGVTLILMLLGLIRKDSGMMLLAALFVVPFAYSQGAWSGFGLFVRLLPLLALGSAFAISKEDAIFAWVLPMPIFGYLIYVLFRILSSGYVGIQPVYIY
jgi:hypothetical protein